MTKKRPIAALGAFEVGDKVTTNYEGTWYTAVIEKVSKKGDLTVACDADDTLLVIRRGLIASYVRKMSSHSLPPTRASKRLRNTGGR